MKINKLTISALFGVMGLTFTLTETAHSQSLCANNPSSSPANCAEIYSATPDRVKLNRVEIIEVAPGESANSQLSRVQFNRVMVRTEAPPTVGTFMNAAPANNVLSKGPKGSDSLNILTTSSYARADLKLNDGSLVWTKPYTQVALANDQGCGVKNLVLGSGTAAGNSNLCLRSGSILVITPPNRANVSVVTDEGTIFTPGTVYLVNRDAQRQRTEVFVFSGAGPLRVFPSNQIGCVQSASPGAAIAPGQECKLRVESGQYVTVTATDLSLPKPFDLPAWVATDPFFAPLITNSNWQLPQTPESLTASLLPNVAAQSVTAAAPGVLDAMGIDQSGCTLNVGNNPFGGASAAENFLLPPFLVQEKPPEIRFIPSPPPVRGLW
ncbi:MAG: FecR domain-containing protein [Microcystaceae cyanobacterium]